MIHLPPHLQSVIITLSKCAPAFFFEEAREVAEDVRVVVEEAGEAVGETVLDKGGVGAQGEEVEGLGDEEAGNGEVDGGVTRGGGACER